MNLERISYLSTSEDEFFGQVDHLMDLAKECASLVCSVKNNSNLLLLKSLTKPFGIGGLRIGYAVASEQLSTSLKALLLPWGVSSIAQGIVPAVIAEKLQ